MDDETNRWRSKVESGPFEGVPLAVADLCQATGDFVERSVGIRPDYTPDTLSLVDHYATVARQELRRRPEVLDVTAQAIGAYFGEVVRRSLVGFWRLPSANQHDWQICGQAAFVAINPLGVGYDAVRLGTDHGGPSSQLKVAPEDRQAVEQRLATVPPVAEEDFYTLCTRHEVLEIVMEAVRSEAERRGYDEILYDEDDYAMELAPLIR